MMVTCIKQHLSNIWSSIHEKLSNTESQLKKSVAYKKKRVHIFIWKQTSLSTGSILKISLNFPNRN